MNLVTVSAALLLLLGTTVGHTTDKESVYVGKIVEVSRDSIELTNKGSDISIGFYGEAKVLDRLHDLRVGDDVRAVFGTGTPPGQTHPINKLLNIRRCVKSDLECSTDLKTEEIQDRKDAKAIASTELRFTQCRRAMRVTLLRDPRYVASSDSDRSLTDAKLKQLNSFTGKRRACADKIMNDHQSAVYDACELHQCGNNIGGGCEHIAGYALSDAVIKQAVLECKAK